MFYKQVNSSGQLIAVGETIDNTSLPNGFIEISKQEYNSFQRVFSIDLETVKLTPINEKGEIIYASV